MSEVVLEQFEKFRALVGGANWGPVQAREMKMAFFAGVGQLLLYQRDEMALEDEEDGARQLQGMLDEVSEYLNTLRRKN